MINYQSGDATRPAGKENKLIIHVCNDIGAWGAGFVLALSNRWPEPEEQYRKWYKNKRIYPFKLGQIQVVNVEPNIAVINMIAQHGCGQKFGIPPIRYNAIKSCLSKVNKKAIEQKASIHAPRFGCGLAGGDWERIKYIIEQEITVPVTIYDF